MDITTIEKPWLAVPASGPFIRTRKAAAYLGVSVAQYYELATQGRVPRPLTIGRRASGIPKPWLDAIISASAEQALASAPSK